MPYNYGKPLKALKELTSFEKILTFREEQPGCFYFNPYQLNIELLQIPIW